MAKVKIVTDSTADMTMEEFKKYGVTMVPLSITIDGETFLDKVDIEQKEFLERMRNTKELPKSSQPAIGTFADVYNELGADGSEILSIHMTGGMSGTVGSAEGATSISDSKVTVYDSRYISKALSFQVIEAAKMAEEGKSVQEIIARLEQIRENSRLFIVIDNLDNLIKGGRIGKMTGIIGSLLNIKPIAMLDDGVLNSVSKARSQSQIIKFIKSRFEEDLDGKKLKGIGIAQANNPELSEKINNIISEMAGIDSIDIVETTPVISTHAGEGALAIMYYWD